MRKTKKLTRIIDFAASFEMKFVFEKVLLSMLTLKVDLPIAEEAVITISPSGLTPI